MDGLIILALGLGLLWSAGANAEDVAAFNRAQRERLDASRAPAWLVRLIAPRYQTSPSVMTKVNRALAGAVVLAGLANLAGLWSF